MRGVVDLENAGFEEDRGDVNRLTKEQIESAEFRQRLIGYGHRLEVSEALQLCDLALMALRSDRDAIIEECARIIEKKVQTLADEHCHGDGGPDGYTWTNKEAEWQAILLDELIQEFRALKTPKEPTDDL